MQAFCFEGPLPRPPIYSTPLAIRPFDLYFFHLLNAALKTGFHSLAYLVNPDRSNPRTLDTAAEQRRKELRYSALGYQMVLLVLFFTGIGYWVDQQWNWAPGGLIAGIVLGSFAAVWSVLKVALETATPDSPNPPEPQTKRKNLP